VVWQLLDDGEQGWHSGSGDKIKAGNRNVPIGGNVDTISIEIVGPSAGAEETGAILCAHLCQKHGFDPKLDIYTHQFWSGKTCPIWILPRWGQFIEMVGSNMGAAAASPAQPKPPAGFAPYLVRVNAANLAIYKGPGTGNAAVGSIKDRGVYTIVEEADGAGAKKWGRLKSGAGWIDLGATTKV